MLRAISIFVILSCAVVCAQTDSGKISGSVADTSNARIAKAHVVVTSPGGSKRQSLTDGQGQFRFENVPYGSYALRVSAPGFHASEMQLSVRASVPALVAIKLAVASSQASVNVNAANQYNTSKTEVVIEESSIKLAPRVARRGALQSLVSETPGWNTENDGLMHVRGVDDGTLYVVGGVPTPDRIDGLFAAPLNLDAITSAEVITGNIPAEFGGRSGSVVVLQPKSGLDNPLSGTLAFGAASFHSDDLSATLSAGTQTWGLFFAGRGHQSDRFLDPIDPRNFNNVGGDVSLDLRFDWRASSRDWIRITGAEAGTGLRVPNNALQEDAGQRQRQRMQHNRQSASWERSWSAQTMTDATYFRSYFSSKLIGSLQDTPITANQDRDHTRQGVVASLSHSRRGQTIKVGAEGERVALSELFNFAITDRDAAEIAGISDAALDFTTSNPFRFLDHRVRSTQSVYAQDEFMAARNLSLSLGLRYDRSSLLLSDQQLSPRLGATYYLPKTKTALRASFNRLYMPPQVENLLIASSAQARELSPFAASGGGADIRPEKLSAWEAGFSQEIFPGLRLDAAYWWRRFDNIDDPNVLLDTTIVFPNSVARAEAQGLDVRLDLRLEKNFSAHFNYSNSQIVEIGPLNGGLFLEDDIIDIGPGTRFVPDHDQRNAASFAVNYAADKRGIWTSFSGRYESGVPIELPDLDPGQLESLPGANLVNFAAGRVKPWYVFGWSAGVDLLQKEHLAMAFQFDLQNLADRPFAFNWGNPFSGTHYGYPQLISGRLKFSFK